MSELGRSGKETTLHFVSFHQHAKTWTQD